MKKVMSVICVYLACLSLTACAALPDLHPGETDTLLKEIFNNSTSIYHELTLDGGPPIKEDFTVYLYQTPADFLVLESPENLDVTFRYELTKDEGAFSMCFEAADDSVTTLYQDGGKVGTPDSDTVILSLKTGENRLYMTGNGCIVKMHCTVSGKNVDKLTYVGITSKDKEMEDLPLESLPPVEQIPPIPSE